MRLYLLGLAMAASLPAQTLEGVVVDRVTGLPVTGAYVRLVSLDGGSAPACSTDVGGRFRFESLPAAKPRWSLAIGHNGYLNRGFSVVAPSGQSIATARIELTPQAVISGKIEDEDGFPVQANMALLEYRLVEGQRELRTIGPTASTNDLGEFRLAELVAGRYYLRVLRQAWLSGWDERYADEYYPGTVNAAEATPLEVRAGQELTGVRMQLKRREGYRITGRVVLPAEVKVANSLQLTLNIVDATTTWPRAFVRVMPDGDRSFSFRHVSPGNYELRLQRTSSVLEPGMLNGYTKLSVGQSDLAGVELRCQTVQPADIQGKVVFTGGAQPRAMEVTLLGEQSNVTARTNDDGTFLLKGVMPGHYSPRAVDASPQVEGHRAQLTFCRFADQALMGRGLDVNGPTDGVLEINVAQDNAEVSARAIGGTPEASSGAYIYLRGIKSTRFYVLRPSIEPVRRLFVLPGAYRVFAIQDQLNLPMVDDAAFLAAHRTDIAIVRLEAGQNPTIDVRVLSR
jgi:hypothetical protein